MLTCGIPFTHSITTTTKTRRKNSKDNNNNNMKREKKKTAKISQYSAASTSQITVHKYIATNLLICVGQFGSKAKERAHRMNEEVMHVRNSNEIR